MLDLLATLPPLLVTLLAGLLSWAATALGAATVLVTAHLPRRAFDAMLGFAAGVMLAASVWSLLVPALALGTAGPLPAWAPAAGGFLLGGGALHLLHRSLPHLHVEGATEHVEGPPSTWRRSTLLVVAVTLHNVPEGLALGVAFGAWAGTGDPGALASAASLTLALAIQNAPEGAAVSIPLRAGGMSRLRAFHFGQLSGAVEPLAALAGAALVSMTTALLPWALAFAAGAMVFVVAEELIPEAHGAGDTTAPTGGLLVGFAVMMVLDTALG